jgi:hypothetical protein
MQINLTWDACANSAASQPTVTHVESSVDGAAFAEIAAQAYGEDAAGLSYADVSVSAGHSYSYRNRFEGPAGMGGYSNETAAISIPASQPVPDAPANLQAVLVP